MRLTCCRWILISVVLLGLAPVVRGQASYPQIGFVYPAGGRQGTTFKIRVGGQYLAGATTLRVSGKGVEGKILSQTRPLTRREIRDLRKKLQDLREKNPKTEADRKAIKEIEKKLVQPKVKPTPALSEVVTVEVTIDPKAEPGPRQLRLQANTGMSNPVVFVVGQLPEVTQQKELINPDLPQPERKDINITLPAVLNSQILPGTADRYRFKARKGQQLVFIAQVRSLIPYLADAVPGWFQAALTLYDSDGEELAFSDDFHNRPDPVLAFKVPEDGEYVLEIKDALYRGREDFVYRLEVGELPFITSIFPIGGKAGTRTDVTLEGWNLDQSSLTLQPSEMKPGVIPLSVRVDGIESNHVPFAVNKLSEVDEKESNNGLKTAQEIKSGVIVNGRIDKPGDWDVFRIEGRGGQKIIAEVWARRLDSPVDSMVKVTDASGKMLAFSDDFEDRGQGLLTHHADSKLEITLPKNGVYYVHMGDAQRAGSSAHAYRLRVSAPRPDFELRVTPCSINARPGSALAITVHALRKDGFDGDIHLFLTYTPVDFALAGAKIPAKQDEVRVTLHVPATERPRPIDLVLEGRAIIRGRRVVRVAKPAEEMMQAFIWHHLVPAKDLMVTISGKARPRFPARLLAKGPVRLVAGGTAVVRLAIPRATSRNKLELVLSDPPEGISVKKSVVQDKGAVLLLHADGEEVRPGLKGNLILEAYPVRNGKRAKSSLGTLPAIPFEVLKLRRRR